VLPFIYETSNELQWTAPIGSYSSVSVVATDEAGNQFVTPPTATTTSVNASLSMFDPSSSNFSLTCSSSGCVSLADVVEGSEMPNDPPSSPVLACTTADTFYFQGYGDPSIRADLVVPTYGPNLWMLYSHPDFWTATSSTCCQPPHCSAGSGLTGTLDTAAVEIHLASSQSQPSYDGEGGQNWSAWCPNSTACTTTPIWPSAQFCPAPACTSTCPYTNQFGQYNCYSSHEVANFWPDTGVFGGETWFAAHLMYYVPLGEGISETQISNGCLVVSMTSMTSNPASPASLQWTPPGPNSCTAAFPSNSAPVQYSTLTSLAQNSNTAITLVCDSWGEPAIMVQDSASGGSGTVYLAALCIAGNAPPDSPLGSSAQGYNNYYVFTSPVDTTTHNTPATLSWSYYAGPWAPANLPDNTITPQDGPDGRPQPIDSLTELDWALRADGSMVAVVTPEYAITGVAGQSSALYQYGCVPVNLDIANKTNPFGQGVSNSPPLATLSDTASTSQGTEQWGPAGCTFDPMSNTGVVMVRHIVQSIDICSSQVECQVFSLVNTGVLP
jgi:hypothetical protein